MTVVCALGVGLSASKASQSQFMLPPCPCQKADAWLSLESVDGLGLWLWGRTLPSCSLLPSALPEKRMCQRDNYGGFPADGYMNHGQNSSKGAYMEDYIGEPYRGS